MLTPAQKPPQSLHPGRRQLSAWYATGRMAEEVANALNLPATPEWSSGKPPSIPAEIMANGMDWTRVDNLTVGKARIWDWMTRSARFDAVEAQHSRGHRRGLGGHGGDLAVRATVYTHCKRAATRAEKALSTGTGTTASPATMGYEGALNYMDVDAAMRS